MTNEKLVTETIPAEDPQEMMKKNVLAAAQLAEIKARTAGGKTHKVKYEVDEMKPTLLAGDNLEIGAADLLKLRTNDLIYYRATGDEYRVRRLIRQVKDSVSMRFITSDVAGVEEKVEASQILGVVMSATRGKDVIRFKKLPTQFDMSAFMEKFATRLQRFMDRISQLFNRNSDG